MESSSGILYVAWRLYPPRWPGLTSGYKRFPLPTPPFFPAFNNSIVAGKKGGRGEDRIRLEAVIISSPFFPATMLLLKAGKKGWKAPGGCLVAFPPSPSLLPGHYAIIKGREEGREGRRRRFHVTESSPKEAIRELG